MSEITDAAAGIQADLEALLLMASEPLPVVLLAETLGRPAKVVTEALGELKRFYDRTARGFQLREVAGGWQYATRTAQADLIARWVIEGQQNRLSQASLETLAVIAYSQPVARSRVSAVRGVNVDGVVRTLMARGLIAEQERDEITGAGLLRTTDYFLERLGLASLDDLPPIAPHLPEAADLAAELSALAIIPDDVEKTDDRPAN
ncbi:SMC-Scp complex subunit ScpB [Brooklawnia sp.]|uniref:SMC-Scp complex subunit ScpB n=1 Tax=Brooklawnia sp. TaxID=2699740 RepID=UPI00311FF87C